MRLYPLFFLPLFLQASVCYFIPPSGWTCANPKNLSSQVQIGFVGKGSSHFRPSINLATEKVNISLKDYLKAVKKIHTSQANTTWRDLGKFTFAAGEGRLTEITVRSPSSDIKMLQALFIQDKTAYILTAAVLKQDYIKEQKTLLQSLQSLSLAPDLYAALPEENQKNLFQDFFQSLKSQESPDDAWKKQQWAKLQSLVEEAGAQMGSHWQFLALKEGHTQIYNSNQ